jgi:hypothetical protein
VQILAQWKQLSTLRQAVLPTYAATAAMSLLIQQTGNIDWTMLWKITDSASAIMTINITTLIDSIYTWYKATREQAATGWMYSKHNAGEMNYYQYEHHRLTVRTTMMSLQG